MVRQVSEAALTVKELSVRYPDGTLAVDAINLALCAGEKVALAGANGAGKTSLLLALVGILKPEAGERLLNGQALTKQTEKNALGKIGMVFQNPDDQLFMPTILEDVAFGPRNRGLSEAEAQRCAREALQLLHCEHLMERSPVKLSLGEKRLAAIATALAMEPDVLLMDEPTSFLDPRARRNLAGLIKKLPQAMLIATHDSAFAADVCSRVVVVRDGRVCMEGEVSLLLNEERMEQVGL